MLDANLRIIRELKLFLQFIVDDSDLLSILSTSPGAFTRRRKLPFERLVLLIARLCKKTLSVELSSFFAEFNLSMDCSVSAFCQQRRKLNPAFFKVWNMHLCQAYYAYTENIKRWSRFRVVAIDGSNISLVNTPLLSKTFGGQRNQQCSYTQAKAIYQYDVLNGLIINAHLLPYRSGELSAAYSMAERLEPDMLAIYDRNFCSYKMMALHLWHEEERKFVIRARERLDPYQTFIASGKQSMSVELSPTPSAIKGLKEQGYIINKEKRITVRLVRVDLPGTVEVLITNLWEDEGYESHLFKDLYFLRWRLETNISKQKNIMQMESFSGLTPLSITQDFFATVFIANLHSILVAPAQKEIDERPQKGKHALKVNGNKSYGKLRTHLIKLFIAEDPEYILRTLQRFFVRDTLPIRPGRSFPRRIVNKQSKSKHKTYMNYKPAF